MKRPDLAIADIIQIINDLATRYPEIADDEELRRDMIEGETEYAAVMERLASAVVEAEDMAEAIKLARARLATRADRYARKAEIARALSLRLMEAADVRRHEAVVATFTRKAVPPSVVIDDEAALPPAFLRVKTEPDKARIKAALESAEAVPGARLTNGGETVQVRKA